MAENETNINEDTNEECIFCQIANDQDKEVNVLYQNKELVCFEDICPVAPHHFLVVPRRHIHSCCSLNRRHVSLVERMTKLGKAVLRDRGIADMEDIRLGFHKPPFISVGHLHLHVLAPSSKISQSMEYKFTPGTDSFVTAECITKRLQKMSPAVLCNVGTCLGLR
ncbi:adenosine 5'-monophosphoramidase HINT3-like [Odontesthes bonariensis]|uniref:adenosine 5'-monophosphoramidase HINT3-like n=1 Tax=Odontesthes bonariensis TaxID=219752 RepID=UPI003F58611F